MTLDPITVLAITGMAIATWATRIGGYLIISRLTLSGRLQAAMEALPPAILSAIVAPMALTTGAAETIAAAVTILTAYRFPTIVAIVVGTGTVVMMRTVLSV